MAFVQVIYVGRMRTDVCRNQVFNKMNEISSSPEPLCVSMPQVIFLLAQSPSKLHFRSSINELDKISLRFDASSYVFSLNPCTAISLYFRFGNCAPRFLVKILRKMSPFSFILHLQIFR